MGFEETVRDVLTVAEAIGGIYTYEDTGRNGINRTVTPAAFNSAGLILPTILIKKRGSTSIPPLVGAGVSSARTIIEVWFYDRENYLAIDVMRESVFGQLHESQIDGAFQVLWNFDVRDERDETIDAQVERSDFWIFHKKGS